MPTICPKPLANFSPENQQLCPSSNHRFIASKLNPTTHVREKTCWARTPSEVGGRGWTRDPSAPHSVLVPLRQRVSCVWADTLEDMAAEDTDVTTRWCSVTPPFSISTSPLAQPSPISTPGVAAVFFDHHFRSASHFLFSYVSISCPYQYLHPHGPQFCSHPA